MAFTSASRAQDAQDPQPAATAPAPADQAYDNGFPLVGRTKEFSLTLNGLLQVRYTATKPGNADAVQNFDVGLARLAFGGNAFSPKVSYLFQFEASTFGNGNPVTLLDGWLQYGLSQTASVKVGRLLLPYSRQFYTHPGNLLLSDLSAADYAFNLPRAVGVHAGATRGRLGYDVAVTNSIRALDGSGQQNPAGRVAVVGRLEISLLQPYGYMESAPSPAPQLSVGFAAAYNPVADASTFQNLRPGDRTRGFTVDAGYRAGRMTAQAAAYVRRNDTGRAQFIDHGGYVQAGVFLVPDTWELAARVAVVDFDRANAPGVSGDAVACEAGVNRYLHGHNVKVQADAGLVHHRAFDGGHRDDRRVRVQFQLLF